MWAVVETGLEGADTEHEPPERALVEVLAAENDAPLSPPIRHPALLPFGQLGAPGI